TVPSPARPTFSGATMDGLGGAERRLAPRREGDDVVQLFDAGFKQAADVARRLTDALLVLDECDAHETLAVLAEGDAGRHRELRLFDQERRELEAAEGLERLRDRGPSEHRGARRGDRPAAAAEGFHEHVGPAV